MLAWLKDNNPRIDALDMPQLVRDGSACQLVHAHARGHGLSIGLLDRYERACLDATIIERGARDFISAKKRKDLLRQFRRLRERGAVSFGMASEGASLHERIEAFMALEAKGWKGRRKTAFLSSTAETKFLRTLAQSLAKQGKCRIYWLALDDRMVAANIVLLDGLGTAYFRKTAYDEDFGAYSPGVLLTMDMTDRFFREPGIVFGDSCAEPDHPMIDHMWRGRLKCVDALVSLQPDRRRAFIWALTLERLRRGLREAAKQAFACIRRH